VATTTTTTIIVVLTASFHDNLDQLESECQTILDSAQPSDDGPGGRERQTLKRTKLQLNHHHQRTNIQIFGPDSLPAAQTAVSSKH